MGFVNNSWIWIYLRTFYLIVFKKSTTNVRWLTIQQAFPAPVQLTEPSSIQFVSRPDPCSASLVIQSWIGFLAEYQTPGSFVRNRVIHWQQTFVRKLIASTEIKLPSNVEPPLQLEFLFRDKLTYSNICTNYNIIICVKVLLSKF